MRPTARSGRTGPILNLYGALSGEPLPKAPQKEKRLRTQNRPLERDIQKTILHGLRHHPAVVWAGRYNSGTMEEAGNGGQRRYVQFNSVPGQSDIMGMLKGGRLLAIEVKRPGCKPTDAQMHFLNQVVAGGGLGMVATSWEDVADMLAISAGFRPDPTLPLADARNALKKPTHTPRNRINEQDAL